jgi:hypothetical protein
MVGLRKTSGQRGRTGTQQLLILAMGGPRRQVALIPFPRKNAHNGANTALDAEVTFETEGDHVNANDVPLRDVFPFLGASQQPRATGEIDDNTRN